MEKTSSPAIDRRSMIIFILLLAAIPLNDVRMHLFTIEGNSDIELQKALVVKALQLRGASAESIVCSENIQRYNITGFRLMSMKEILDDRMQSAVDTSSYFVSNIEFNGSDAHVDVLVVHYSVDNEWVPRDDVDFTFHKLFLNLWNWSHDYPVN